MKVVELGSDGEVSPAGGLEIGLGPVQVLAGLLLALQELALVVVQIS